MLVRMQELIARAKQVVATWITNYHKSIIKALQIEISWRFAVVKY